MVLVGQVGRDLVGLINTHSTVAVGMSGEDGGLFIAERRHSVVDGDEVDLGLVGDVVSVRTEAVAGLIDSGSVPVVASIAPDVTPELALATIDSITVLGALHASKDIKSALADRIG